MKRWGIGLLAVASLSMLAACSNDDPQRVVQTSPPSVSTPAPDDYDLDNVIPMDPDNPPEFVAPTASSDLSTAEGVCEAITELNMDDLDVAIAVNMGLTDGKEPLTDDQKQKVEDYRIDAMTKECPQWLPVDEATSAP